jgi:hypothetical protein
LEAHPKVLRTAQALTCPGCTVISPQQGFGGMTVRVSSVEFSGMKHVRDHWKIAAALTAMPPAPKR